jgi:hypothetical protein
MRAESGDKHKMKVLVYHDGKQKLIRFGLRGMQDYTQHKDKKRRENYLKRSAGIRDGDGNLTKDNPFSANYWSRRILWDSGEPIVGPVEKKMEFGGMLSRLPESLQEEITWYFDDNEIADAIEENENRWRLVIKKNEWEVVEDYIGNTGDPFESSTFDNYKEAKEEFDSLEEPSSWESRYSEHYAELRKYSYLKEVIFEKDGEQWDLQNETSFEKEENEDYLLEHKSLGKREETAEGLMYAIQKHLNAYYGRRKESYAEIRVRDNNNIEIGSIQVRVKDHTENPKNIKSWYDYHLSIVVANIDETKNRFHTRYSDTNRQLIFSGDDEESGVLKEIDDALLEAAKVVIENYDGNEQLDTSEFFIGDFKVEN